MLFKIIFHLSTATQATPTFHSPSAPHMTRVTWIPSLHMHVIERCIKAIRCWMGDNELLLDEAKTEFLLIGTKLHLSILNIGHV